MIKIDPIDARTELFDCLVQAIETNGNNYRAEIVYTKGGSSDSPNPLLNFYVKGSHEVHICLEEERAVLYSKCQTLQLNQVERDVLYGHTIVPMVGNCEELAEQIVENMNLRHSTYAKVLQDKSRKFF